jgi:hypothetical protein
MKLKKEYLILIGVIAVLAIVFVVSGGRSKMRYRVPVLESLEKEGITRIEITRLGETVLLSKSQDVWTILPQEYKADPNKISSLLDVIADLALTELASEKKDDLRYELDEENKIGVRAFSGETLVREFDVGKVSPTYRHTFVRVGGDSRIYHARDSFRSTFDVDRSGLRHKSVMTFDKNEITEASISQEEGAFHFTKKLLPPESQPAETDKEEEEELTEPAEPEEVWETEEGTRAKKTAVDSILNQLSDLSCDEFIEDKSKEDFVDPICTVMLTGSKEFSLRIFAKDDEADKYPALSSENPYPFFLSTWKAESFMKKPEDLLEKEEETEKTPETDETG